MTSNSSEPVADGSHWRVRRRWSNRPAPRLRWRRSKRDGETWLDGLTFFDVPDASLGGLAVCIGVAIALALIVFVLLPLLGIAFELALLIAVISSGVLGRIFLRRPWTIEAVSLDDPDIVHAFAVKGWRRSRRAIAELNDAIRDHGAPPAQLTEAERLPADRQLRSTS